MSVVNYNQFKSTKSYTLPPAAVVSAFQTNQESGLSDAEVSKRRDYFGSNNIETTKSVSTLRRIWEELTNPLVLVLVVALGLTLYLGELVDATVVLLAIVLNISMALYQQGKAEDIFRSLEKEQAINARVRRNNQDVVIASSELVPGDIIYIASGGSIAADIRLLKVDGAQADEAVLTGEWEAVNKDVSPLKSGTPIAEQNNMLFSGTLLANGSGFGVVVATGGNTEFGQLASATMAVSELTPLQKQLQKLAYLISGIVSFLSIIIVVIGLMRDVPLAEIMLIAIAVAVSAVPEGLPSAITAILAVGMRHVLQEDGLVKSLLAAETLGATDVIITDKTGTLTEGRMTLVSIIPAFTNEVPNTDEIVSLSSHQKTILISALLCSDGYVTSGDDGLVAHGRPVEKALVEAGLRLGFNRGELNNDDEELDFLPFASERRFAAVLVEGTHGHYAILSGAPEYMVSHANYYYDNDGTPNLMTDSDRARLNQVQSTLAARGHRLTGIARVPIKAHKFDELDQEDILGSLGKQLEFVGFLGFTDPVRGDVPKSIREAQAAGARVIVATGDNKNTALAIAAQAGICISDDLQWQVREGRELVDLTDEELYETFKKVSVFARMRPIQKQHLATVLQKYSHVVAMTGDGVNDAPALASADVGIAVHSGTDVAKSAADLILLKNSFATIVSAVREGRRLLDNIRRVVVHRISAGFGEVLLVISALLLTAPMPILPKQILWINIIQGGLLTFAYAFEPADKDVMTRPPNQSGSRGILNTQVIKLLTYSSLAFGVITLMVYFGIRNSSLVIDIDQLRTLMFAILTIDVIAFSFALKDFNRPVWEIDILSNPVLLLAVGISSATFLASMLLPVLREFLSLAPLPALLWVIIAVVAVVEILLIELIKWRARVTA